MPVLCPRMLQGGPVYACLVSPDVIRWTCLCLPCVPGCCKADLFVPVSCPRMLQDGPVYACPVSPDVIRSVDVIRWTCLCLPCVPRCYKVRGCYKMDLFMPALCPQIPQTREWKQQSSSTLLCAFSLTVSEHHSVCLRELVPCHQDMFPFQIPPAVY